MTYNSTTTRRTWLQRLSQACLGVAGWRAEVAEPLPARCVMIGAHHTTWFDFVMNLLLMGATGLRYRWMAKSSLFRKPFGGIMRALGGMPVERGARANFVDQVVAQLHQHESLIIALLPEGTRRHTSHWKTGFYYIALGAQVPIALGYVDYKRRRIGVGPILMPTGDIEADFVRYRDFYATITGLHPERQGDVRLLSDG